MFIFDHILTVVSEDSVSGLGLEEVRA